VSTVGIVNGTEVGEALVARLASDGRKVISGVDTASFRRIGAEARLVLIDARRNELPAMLRVLGEHLDPNHLVVHTVHSLGGEASIGGLIEAESAVRRTGVLAGPLLVGSLREGRPTAAVIASRHPEVVEEFAEALSTPKLRVYRSRDPIGVELCGSLVELALLGCGAVDTLALGAAARTLLVVRAVRELGRLVQVVGGDPVTATGLAGLGDILVRGVDDSSSAYRLGAALAKGDEIDPAAMSSLQQTARRLSALKVGQKASARLFDGLASFVRDRVPPGDLIEQLMTVPVLDE
jgi:glycerol-3-phosphate dehydrogenase (NAD(P)+)